MAASIFKFLARTGVSKKNFRTVRSLSSILTELSRELCILLFNDEDAINLVSRAYLFFTELATNENP